MGKKIELTHTIKHHEKQIQQLFTCSNQKSEVISTYSEIKITAKPIK